MVILRGQKQYKMIGNPSQEKAGLGLEGRAIKLDLIEKIKKYEKTGDSKLKKEIEGIIELCLKNDINVLREKRIFDKIK